MPRPKTVKYPNLVLRMVFDNHIHNTDCSKIRGWLSQTDDTSLSHSMESQGGKYVGVQIHSQTDDEQLANEIRGDIGPMYAVDLIWESDGRNNLRECQRGVAALTDLNRKLDALQEKSGKPASFGAWVQRVCGAIGLDKVNIPGEGKFLSPERAAYLIDVQIKKWAELAKERGYEQLRKNLREFG